MSEQFVRNVNGAWCEELYRPIRSRVSQHRRALVNEIAFRLFSNEAATGRRSGSPFVREDEANEIFEEIIQSERWAHLRRVAEPDIYERREISVLKHRLRHFFSTSLPTYI